VALLATAVAVPSGAIAAVLLVGRADVGLLQLSPPGPRPPAGASPVQGARGPGGPAGDRTNVLAGDRTAGPARGSTRQPLPAARVGTRDGRLNFVAPPGWLYGPCPQGGDSCVEIAPGRLGGGDAIDVLVTSPAAGDTSGAGSAADPADDPANDPADDPADDLAGDLGPGGARVLVDGLPAIRLDLPSNASVLVYGTIAQGGDRFMVSCRYAEQQQLIRRGCDQVVASLTVLF
jgi:hypothetical protein